MKNSRLEGICKKPLNNVVYLCIFDKKSPSGGEKLLVPNGARLREALINSTIVIPAEAGIQRNQQHGFPLPRE